MLSLYSPGNSLIHRIPAWIKLLALCLCGTTVMFISAWPILGGALGLIGTAYIIARIPIDTLWRISRAVLFFIALIVCFQWVFSSGHLAAIVGLRILFLIAAANLLTLTTTMSDLVSTVETILSPLTRLGIRPDRVGIAVSLTLRFIPVLIEQGSRIREAQAARRVKAPLTFLVPLIIRTLRMADGVGEALEVRSSLGDSCGRRNIPDTMNPLNAVQVSPKGAP